MHAKRLIVAASLLGLLAAAAALTWAFWPGPPPATVEEVTEAIMAADPAGLSKEELAAYVKEVRSGFERLPPHAFEAFFAQTAENEGLRERMGALRERVRTLSPEEREKLPRAIPTDQRMTLMTKRMEEMVEELEMLPPEEREEALRSGIMGRFGGRGRGEGRPDRGRRPAITKERFIERRAQTSPTQRAKFHVARRKMLRLLDEGGR